MVGPEVEGRVGGVPGQGDHTILSALRYWLRVQPWAEGGEERVPGWAPKYYYRPIID